MFLLLGGLGFDFAPAAQTQTNCPLVCFIFARGATKPAVEQYTKYQQLKEEKDDLGQHPSQRFGFGCSIAPAEQDEYGEIFGVSILWCWVLLRGSGA